MATEALKSTAITNRDASPPVLNSPTNELGLLRESFGHLTTTSGVTAGSTYRMCAIPSNARVSDVIIAAAAMTAGAFDVGVYRNTADGGAVVDADYFATAVDCAAAVPKTSVINESGTNTLTKQIMPLWQAIGMASDPKSTLDIVCTSTSTITAGALLGICVQFVQ